jgi:hypothetical protein
MKELNKWIFAFQGLGLHGKLQKLHLDQLSQFLDWEQLDWLYASLPVSSVVNLPGFLHSQFSFFPHWHFPSSCSVGCLLIMVLFSICVCAHPIVFFFSSQ